MCSTATLPYFRSGLGAVRLTEAGKAFARQRNWLVTQSEWEHLDESHAGEIYLQHTALILAFAREARYRGYQVVLTPSLDSVPTRIQPDMLLKGQTDRLYVEVERSREPKTEKWDNLDKLQGFVAVCVQSRARRKRLAARLRSLNLPGQATDLETLSQCRAGGEPGPLWLEHW